MQAIEAGVPPSLDELVMRIALLAAPGTIDSKSAVTERHARGRNIVRP